MHTATCVHAGPRGHPCGVLKKNMGKINPKLKWQEGVGIWRAHGLVGPG